MDVSLSLSKANLHLPLQPEPEIGIFTHKIEYNHAPNNFSNLAHGGKQRPV
jgi:hypothetical protein